MLDGLNICLFKNIELVFLFSLINARLFLFPTHYPILRRHLNVISEKLRHISEVDHKYPLKQVGFILNPPKLELKRLCLHRFFYWSTWLHIALYTDLMFCADFSSDRRQ